METQKFIPQTRYTITEIATAWADFLSRIPWKGERRGDIMKKAREEKMPYYSPMICKLIKNGVIRKRPNGLYKASKAWSICELEYYAKEVVEEKREINRISNGKRIKRNKKEIEALKRRKIKHEPITEQMIEIPARLLNAPNPLNIVDELKERGVTIKPKEYNLKEKTDEELLSKLRLFGFEFTATKIVEL